MRSFKLIKTSKVLLLLRMCLSNMSHHRSQLAVAEFSFQGNI